MSGRQILSLAFVWALPFTVCGSPQGATDVKNAGKARQGYQQLLEQFPEDNQGCGIDTLPSGTECQPMTYGLVLSAEALHYQSSPNEESGRRVRKATLWLMENADLDKDDLPGWGLPQPWDAFADGTTNGPNQPYTITTAIVLNGLLDSLLVPSLWTKSEQKQIHDLSRNIVLRWCRDLWSEGFGGGYFWYSPCPCDNIFAVNSPAMFLGSMSRFLKEQGNSLSLADRRLMQAQADDLTKAIVNTVQMRRGAPFWDYMPIPNKFNNRQTPNDLVHQVYILWGTEVYRDCVGTARLPWTRAQALASLDRYWRNGLIYNFPQDVTYTEKKEIYGDQKALLWGAGAMLAFHARYGSETQASHTLDTFVRAYDPPRVWLSPQAGSKNAHFYPRHAAHALWGWSGYCFTSRN